MEPNDLLSSVLNDPEKLQEVMKMASSLLGGANTPRAEQPADEPPPVKPDSAPEPAGFHDAVPSFSPAAQPLNGAVRTGGGAVYDPSAELMQKAIPVLSEIARSGQNAVSREKLNLLNAVKPFVASNIGAQIDHGLRLVSIARMATAALHQLGTTEHNGKEDAHV